MNFADEDGSGEAIEMEEKSKSSTMMIEREHMFDKVVTPSDVGKLNRLVIPKQHAEKYFPLDSTVNEKGLLLNFEDGTGKPWRFRYSYWNSSQSYVMTKGWSRFVKEKKLDAGDIVSFQRGVGVGDEFGRDKLFIDWRRRLPTDHGNSVFHHLGSHGRVGGNCVPTPGFVLRSYPHPHPHPYPLQMQPGYPYPQVRRPGLGVGSGCYGYPGYPVAGSVIFLRSTSSATGMITSANTNTNTTREEEAENVYESVPVVQGKAEAKRLRLFGVNMECTSTPISNQAHDFDILSSSLAPSSSSSSTTSNHHHHHQHNTTTGISIGPPSSTNTLRSFFNGTSSEKGKSSTSSSSMSLDLDI